VPPPKVASTATKKAPSKNEPRKAKDLGIAAKGSPKGQEEMNPPKGSNAVGLTVRVEVNLPANGDQETYDRIFRSIRENLIDGK
jgi:hypothetical protein